MKLKTVLISLLFVGLLAVACAPTPATPVPTAMPTLEPTPSDPSALAVQAAVEALAYNLSIPEDSIQVTSVEAVEWPDSCLGAGTGSMACQQVITPGYKIILTADGKNYEYHTNLDGSSVMLASTSEAGGSLPPAAFAARRTLAEILGVEERSLTILSADRVDWGNGCLGISTELACTDEIVPGYRVMLTNGTTTYEMRTDGDGTLSLLTPSGAGITLELETAGACRRITTGAQTISNFSCNGARETRPAQLTDARVEQLNHYLQTYRTFMVTNQVGRIIFNGAGNQTATLAEQRALTEWMVLVEAETYGTNNPAISLTYDRTGGIAGFCDHVQVERSGIAYVGRCNNFPQESILTVYLTTEQLGSLFTWIDELKEASYKQDDGAVADSMQTELQFSGSGTQSPSAEQIQAMLNLCSQLAIANRTP